MMAGTRRKAAYYVAKESREAKESKGDSTLSSCLHDCFDSPSGRTSLAWILNECGYFGTDEGDVNPSLIAFANRLLKASNLGIAGNAGIYVQALLDSYMTDSQLEEE